MVCLKNMKQYPFVLNVVRPKKAGFNVFRATHAVEKFTFQLSHWTTDWLEWEQKPNLLLAT